MVTLLGEFIDGVRKNNPVCIWVATEKITRSYDSLSFEDVIAAEQKKD